jgi:hypothetical protein
MKIWEVTTKAYGPDDYDRITAEKDRERKESRLDKIGSEGRRSSLHGLPETRINKERM